MRHEMTIAEIAALRRSHLQQAGQLRLLADAPHFSWWWVRRNLRRLAGEYQGKADELGVVLTGHVEKSAPSGEAKGAA